MDAATADMTQRHAAILGELAELGLALASDLQAQALAEDEPTAKAALADSFHKISRSVRQSLALEARLHREAHRVDREAAAEPRHRRSAQVRARLERLVWTEAEDIHTARYWNEGVTRLLAEAEFEPDFDARPVAELVEALGQAIRTKQAPIPDPPDLDWRAYADTG